MNLSRSVLIPIYIACIRRSRWPWPTSGVIVTSSIGFSRSRRSLSPLFLTVDAGCGFAPCGFISQLVVPVPFCGVADSQISSSVDDRKSLADGASFLSFHEAFRMAAILLAFLRSRAVASSRVVSRRYRSRLCSEVGMTNTIYNKLRSMVSSFFCLSCIG